MLQSCIRCVLLALGLAATAPAALAQQFGPVERRAVIDEVAAMPPAEREAMLMTALPQWVATLQGQMPRRIDDMTTATGIAYAPPVIEFAYQTDPRVGFAPEAMADRQALLAQAICSQRDMVFILALGVTFRFSYRVGKDEMGSIALALDDCPAMPVVK